MSSIAANFAGWSSNTARAATSPTTTWTGAAIAATTNGISEPQPDVAIGMAAQEADRVDRGEQEARDQVGGQEHVRDLVRRSPG